MSLFSVFEISSAGMDVQQARLEVAASNIANARTTGKNGQAYQPLSVVVRSAIAEAQGAAGTPITAGQLPLPMVAEIVPQNVAPKLVYDPGHPDADERGMVALPGVDPVSSMLDLISISRGYEANLRAFDITRSLLQRTLDLGRGR
ncbi:MAG TPA: flagellar basal body rod protein FlgC [Steroidobacteraceae bacterium]|jgi:flagellar basal-body rod protein FlgC|nr:flagellar basal body rod protein FlgC [Steroidobacteraceae bacterium]